MKSSLGQNTRYRPQPNPNPQAYQQLPQQYQQQVAVHFREALTSDQSGYGEAAGSGPQQYQPAVSMVSPQAPLMGEGQGGQLNAAQDAVARAKARADEMMAKEAKLEGPKSDAPIWKNIEQDPGLMSGYARDPNVRIRGRRR